MSVTSPAWSAEVCGHPVTVTARDVDLARGMAILTAVRYHQLTLSAAFHGCTTPILIGSD